LWRPIPSRLLGIIAAFGAGILTSSVAYELVGEAFRTSAGEGGVAIGLVAGAVTFFVGDLLIERMGRGDRHDSDAQGPSSGLAVMLGTVLDGIPESLVLGIGLTAGSTPSIAMLVAVFVSNFPEGLAATASLASDGWSHRRLVSMWVGIALVSAVAAGLGFLVFDDASARAIAFVLAFAGGAVLTMLADTMLPDAFEHAGPIAGLVTTIGFGVGFALATL
jgi:ZIP family zinc transporter